MPEGLDLPLNIGAGGLVVLIVTLVLTGRLVSRKTADTHIAIIQASRDEALKREEYYKVTIERLQETVSLQQKQIDELMEQSRMSVALLESIEYVSRAARGRHHRETDSTIELAG